METVSILGGGIDRRTAMRGVHRLRDFLPAMHTSPVLWVYNLLADKPQSALFSSRLPRHGGEPGAPATGTTDCSSTRRIQL